MKIFTYLIRGGGGEVISSVQIRSQSSNTRIFDFLQSLDQYLAAKVRAPFHCPDSSYLARNMEERLECHQNPF